MLETILKKLPYVMGLNRQISELEKALDATNAKIKSSEAATSLYDRSKAVFDSEGMIITDGRQIPFLTDPKFDDAYVFGIDSGHLFAGPGGKPTDLTIRWRVAIVCWAAWYAKNLTGDFVECGVNTGILSRALCRFIDFNQTGKALYLFDTFEGIPLDQADEGFGDEIPVWNTVYPDVWELAKANFADFPNVHLIRGKVPETLTQAPIETVAYLSIDMNIVYPEVAALEYFWPKLVTGAVVVLDDYGYHVRQRVALDQLVEGFGAKIWLLPTGQGLLFKS